MYVCLGACVSMSNVITSKKKKKIDVIQLLIYISHVCSMCFFFQNLFRFFYLITMALSSSLCPFQALVLTFFTPCCLFHSFMVFTFPLFSIKHNDVFDHMDLVPFLCQKLHLFILFIRFTERF